MPLMAVYREYARVHEVIKMKGMSISTNTLIFLAVAFIVLLALLSLMSGIIPGGSQTLRCQASFRSGCNKFIAAGGCKEDTGINPVPIYVDESIADCAIGTHDQENVTNACCGTQ